MRAIKTPVGDPGFYIGAQRLPTTQRQVVLMDLETFLKATDMSKSTLIASGYCDTAVKAGRSLDEIMGHLEHLFAESDDEPVVLLKGDHHEIFLVYDDSRPNELIFSLPKGYK